MPDRLAVTDPLDRPILSLDADGRETRYTYDLADSQRHSLRYG